MTSQEAPYIGGVRELIGESRAIAPSLRVRLTNNASV
jgi:hypothetical protein